MQDIDLTAQRIVEQISSGHTEEAADALDRAYHSMGPEEFRKVVEAMERKTRDDSLESRAGESRTEIQPTVKLNEWVMYTPWTGNLFESRGR